MPRQWAADEYIWRQLANDLSARIAEGTYPLGCALPAEDELASEYALARATVRRFDFPVSRFYNVGFRVVRTTKQA